jgi:hypothetical protein
MSARHRRKVPGCFYGVDRESHWRDPRTGTRLAPGAIQNWPTRYEEEQMKQDRASFNKAMRELKEQEGTKKN